MPSQGTHSTGGDNKQARGFAGSGQLSRHMQGTQWSNAATQSIILQTGAGPCTIGFRSAHTETIQKLRVLKTFLAMAMASATFSQYQPMMAWKFTNQSLAAYLWSTEREGTYLSRRAETLFCRGPE
jgi:hypothetical protein